MENTIQTETLGSIRQAEAPKKSLIAYKLFRVENGQPYPLFIDNNSPLPLGVWLDADSATIDVLQQLEKGFYLVDKNGNATQLSKSPGSPEVKKLSAQNNGSRYFEISYYSKQKGGGKAIYNLGVSKSKVGRYAFRPGWHACDTPSAIHIGLGSKKIKDFRRANEFWYEIEISADNDYTQQAHLSKREAGGLDFIPENGFYFHITNGVIKKYNPNQKWVICGSIKINRQITDSEAKEICIKSNVVPDIPRVNKKGLGFATFDDKEQCRTCKHSIRNYNNDLFCKYGNIPFTKVFCLDYDEKQSSLQGYERGDCFSCEHLA